MKKKTPFLDFYYKYAPGKKGDKVLPGCGLCSSINLTGEAHDIFKLLMPDGEFGFGIREHNREGPDGAWGAIDNYPNTWKFNHFRQNVILLCAALDGEL